VTTVGAVVEVIESRFPPALAADWDVVGLAVGDPDATVTRVLLAVDVTAAVIAEAREAGAQLIVTHHPLLLRGVTSVAASTAKGSAVHALIEAGIAQYAAHTNADAGTGGVADALALALGVAIEGPLLAAADQAAPGVGTGRVGGIVPTPLGEFAARVAAALPATAGGVLYAGDPDAIVRRVAVVGGAGDAYIDAAVEAGVDAYVTADLRHHVALEAREAAAARGGRPYLLSVSHAASESLWLADLGRAIAEATGVAVQVSTLNTDPWTGRAGGPER